MVTEIRSPVVENVILPRVKSIQKIAITNGINTRYRLFILQLSLFSENCADFVSSFHYVHLLPHLSKPVDIWRFASIYGIGRNTDRRPFIEHERVCWKWTMPEFYASLPGLYNATIYQVSRYMTKRVTYGVNCCRYDNVSRLNNFYSRYKYVYLRGNILQNRFGDHLISAVLIGQDRDFLKKIYIPHESFKTKYTIENLNRAEEIYFGSAHCDSLLLTASGSTFGWWMGYLMPENQQDRIFYNIQASKDLKFGKDVYDYDSFPPEWKRLTLIDNYTVAYEPRWRYQIDADRAREREEKEKADAEVEAQKLDVELVEVEAKGQEEKSEQTEETENDGPDVEMKREDKEFGPELKQPEVEENDT
ncbi:hypothetical protein M3Y94_00025800 [Aphelenchoides besseyi]|nr:hypothetical protein M3Y94_00025800 [Aphelenchoides besseyi]